MKKQLIISSVITIMILAGAYNSYSYAEMCRCTDGTQYGMHEESMPPMSGKSYPGPKMIVRTGDGLHEEGMPPMPEMPHPGMGMMVRIGPEHAMWRSLMSLGLDDKQKEAIKEIKNKVMKEMIKKSANEQVANIELRELLDKDPVNMKAVEAKLKQIETVETEMHLTLIRAREEVISKLTPDQAKRFKEMSNMAPPMGSLMMGGTMRGFMRMPLPSYKEQEG
jgi:Spy/CpxP family protein refolding chaperone